MQRSTRTENFQAPTYSTRETPPKHHFFLYKQLLTATVGTSSPSGGTLSEGTRKRTIVHNCHLLVLVGVNIVFHLLHSFYSTLLYTLALLDNNEYDDFSLIW